jgi:hypothetical protein
VKCNLRFVRAFISSSMSDRDFRVRLVNFLHTLDVDTWEAESFKVTSDTPMEMLEEAIRESDIFIVVLSKASVSSTYVQNETTTALFSGRISVISVLIEDCQVPTYLSGTVWLDFRNGEAKGFESLRRGIMALHQGIPPSPSAPSTDETSHEQALEFLKTAYNSGDLTLICGAGVSISAGLPDWSQLLAQLLAAMFGDEVSARHSAPRLADIFKENTSASPPIVAQYLKSVFGDDFSSLVRQALYEGVSGHPSSAMTDAIANLCRPRRARQALRAVVTFNFDDLLERQLLDLHIEHSVIHEEGQRSHPSTLPVYHVHGYLPQESSLVPSADFVFAEDAYHSQFIDPFSWANLVQLEALTQSTCLLIGVSLTDPNLRRLLDVAMRKTHSQNHYIVWRGRSSDHYTDEISRIFQQRLSVLEEQDANRLGLGVIWVKDYSDIPVLMDKIGAFTP